MNANEIVRTLRKSANGGAILIEREWATHISPLSLDAAADLIESLQGQLESTWEWDMYQCAKREIERLQIQSEQRYQLYSGALDTIERLEAQLSESQRRERATAIVEAGVNPDGTVRYACPNPKCGHLFWRREYVTEFCSVCGQALSSDVAIYKEE